MQEVCLTSRMLQSTYVSGSIQLKIRISNVFDPFTFANCMHYPTIHANEICGLQPTTPFVWVLSVPGLQLYITVQQVNYRTFKLSRLVAQQQFICFPFFFFLKKKNDFTSRLDSKQRKLTVSSSKYLTNDAMKALYKRREKVERFGNRSRLVTVLQSAEKIVTDSNLCRYQNCNCQM